MPAPATRKGALGEAYQPPPPEPSDQTSLNVALYPYLPDPGAFIGAVREAWRQLATGISLNFCFYDPYTLPPPPTLDVFAFDCIFADDLVTAGQIEPILASEIRELTDIMQFARENAALDPNASAFAGIPYLGCTTVLYYRKGDPQLDNNNPLGIEQLHTILGDATYQGPEPPPGSGLLMDLGGKTTDACTYASFWRTLHSTWWPSPLPMGGPFDTGVLQELGLYAGMAGSEQALYEDPGHDRTSWFEAGKGRALVGLTETMSAWRPDVLQNLRFRPLPSAPSGNASRVLCYADAVGIRPNLGGKRAAALQLANVVASQAVGLAALESFGANAQYLIPTRWTVLQRLGTQLAQYSAIMQMVDNYALTSFRLGKGVRGWAHNAGAEIINLLFPSEGAAEAPIQPVRRRHGYETTPAGLWRRER
jgi:thiamine pyridinylase